MNKLDEAVDLLKLSLEEYERDPDNKVIIAGVIKSFEISFEYVWKSFKKIGNEAGNEVYNPRDAIKSASEMGLIEDFEIWKQFLNARNLSVHDYLGVTDKEILEISKSFLGEIAKIKWGQGINQ
jgi:nucleotidyltransferase substrate binding protein (TIGR01987 family)